MMYRDTEESSEPGLGYDFAALDVDESDPIEQTDRSSDHGEITQETWQYGQAPISAPTPVEDTEREDGDDEGEPVPDPWKGSSTVGGGTGSDD